MSNAKQTVTVVCETHGLRYNPDIHMGCVRCRKAAGEVIGAPSRVQAPVSMAKGPSPSSSSMVVALLVAGALIMGSSSVFYLSHRAAWVAAKEAHERWMEEGGKGLTPQQQEQIEELKKALGGLGGDPQ